METGVAHALLFPPSIHEHLRKLKREVKAFMVSGVCPRSTLWPRNFERIFNHMVFKVAVNLILLWWRRGGVEQNISLKTGQLLILFNYRCYFRYRSQLSWINLDQYRAFPPMTGKRRSVFLISEFLMRFGDGGKTGALRKDRPFPCLQRGSERSTVELTKDRKSARGCWLVLAVSLQCSSIFR